jgi:hypothetical protein
MMSALPLLQMFNFFDYLTDYDNIYMKLEVLVAVKM